jgi:hypothetical protein
MRHRSRLSNPATGTFGHYQHCRHRPITGERQRRHDQHVYGVADDDDYPISLGLVGKISRYDLRT